MPTARHPSWLTLFACILLLLQPELPSTADVRGAVRQAIEEARRLPPMPLMPVDYSALLADIQSWIAALEAASADVAAAQQVSSWL